MNLRDEIQRFDAKAPLEAAKTPPASWYRDPRVFELERAILKSAWQPIGTRQALEKPGDYFAGEFLNEPFFAIQGSDGQTRVFSNVCRHHASCLLSGQSNVSEIVCPYHAWTYDLTGALKRAPHIAGIKDFNKTAFGLHPLETESWGPVLFSRFGEPGLSLRESYPGLFEAFKKPAPLRYVRRAKYTLECNWKVFVDNYLDGGYHVPHMHPGLSAKLALESYRSDIYDTYSIQRCGGNSESRDGRVGEEALYAWLYPNTMLNRYGPWLDVNWVIPVAVDKTLVVFDYYLEEDRADDISFIESSLRASDEVQKEDIEICARVQKGLLSDHYDVGRYAPRFEGPMYAFHQKLAGDLTELLCRAEI